MKYTRFTQVDSETKISINRQQSKNGQSWPDLKGLNVLFQDNISKEYWYGTVDDDAVDDQENYCFFISLEELSEYVLQNIQKLTNDFRDELYENEKKVRDSVLGKYHATASLAGIYKYNQAVELLADPDATADLIRTEADLRGMDVVAMAERIKNNHEAFRLTESKIAGIRGKLLDRLNSFQYNSTDPVASWNEFNKMEIIATVQREQLRPRPMQPNMQQNTIEITVRYYGTDIDNRLKYLE